MLEVSWFVCGVLYSLLYCYLFCKMISNDKFELNFRTIISSILFGIYYLILMNFDAGVMHPYLTNLGCFIILLYCYRQPIIKIVISILCIFILIGISELLFDLIFIFFVNNLLVDAMSNPIIYFVSNIFIYIIALLLSKIKMLNKIFRGIISWYNKNEFKSLLIFSCLALSIITFILYHNFFKSFSSSILVLSNLFCMCIIVFVIGFFKEKSNNNRIIAEYDQLLEYVKNYEKLIETKSKNQHEYKNQLILIQGMIKSKEAISYIDELLKNEKEDQNVELLKKLQYLPQGGLKGLIYYKIEKMIDKKIDVYVDIASNLKNTKVLKDNLQDISKIIGVYLDNAIEAVEKADKKYIIIESYMEDGNIVFSFSNTYKGNIDLNKVDKEGYTTKGEGKGYGLSLVRDIIEKNNKFSQKRELNGIYYVQKLYIKK